MEINANPIELLALVSAGLALLFDYAPVLAQKFDALPKARKQLIMLGLTSATGALVFAGQCYGVFNAQLVCGADDALRLSYGIILAVAVNFGFHQATKPSAAFKKSLLSFKA